MYKHIYISIHIFSLSFPYIYVCVFWPIFVSFSHLSLCLFFLAAVLKIGRFGLKWLHQQQSITWSQPSGLHSNKLVSKPGRVSGQLAYILRRKKFRTDTLTNPQKRNQILLSGGLVYLRSKLMKQKERGRRGIQRGEFCGTFSATHGSPKILWYSATCSHFIHFKTCLSTAPV